MRKGRLAAPLADSAVRYTESVSFDWRLYHEDILGSITHARALAAAGIISADEREKIETGLREIASEIERGECKWMSRSKTCT
ncbi:MAG TPA: hypothetical protein VFO30_07505 [Chthoniobacterales bacterium]|nr:hypothetical protein [Chthoniobacterales bacterium]